MYKKGKKHMKRTLTEKQKKMLSAAAIIIFILLFAALAWFVGRPMIRFARQPEQFRSWVDGHGALGCAAYAAMVFLQVVVAIIPGEPLEIAGGYAFGAWWGTALCLIGAVLGSRGDDELLRLPGLGMGEANFLSMEGTKVFKFAVEVVPACIDAVLEKAGMTAEDVDFFVFHQANARIIDLAVRKYRIPPEKYYKNIENYGNTAAASVPLVLSELEEQGRIGPGSRMLVVAFGGGLTWGGAMIEFA